MPKLQDGSEFQMDTESMAYAVTQCRALISQYAEGQFASKHPHSRKGRAGHLAAALQESDEALQSLVGIKSEEDKHDFSEIYARLIALLFLHYQSIADPKSELSRKLETGLMSLLHVDKEEIRYSDAQEERKSLEALDLNRVYQTMSKLFSTTQTGTRKETEPFYLFLKNLIIQDFPSVRDMLFENTGTEDKPTYSLLPQVDEVLTQLKEKDAQETRVFRHQGTEKQDFDALFSDEGDDLTHRM